MINNIIEDIKKEYEDACDKHPEWPEDLVHAVAIITEEVGELTQAVLQKLYEKKSSYEDIRKEAVQVGAMALRFILNFDSMLLTENYTKNFFTDLATAPDGTVGLEKDSVFNEEANTDPADKEEKDTSVFGACFKRCLDGIKAGDERVEEKYSNKPTSIKHIPDETETEAGVRRAGEMFSKLGFKLDDIIKIGKVCSELSKKV